MKRLSFIILFFFICSVFSQSISNDLEQRVELELKVKKLDKCYFFCHFLEITIKNNNEKGIYLPSFDGFDLINIYNEKGINITYNVMMYESLNKLSNSELRKEDIKALKRIGRLENAYNPFRKKAIDYQSKIIEDIFQKDSFTYYVSKSKLKFEELNNLDDFTKNTIKEIKYGFNIAFVPASSSRKLYMPINYLFQNFVVEGHPIKPFYISHGHPEEKEIFEHNYSEAWENYEDVITNKVKIIFDYGFGNIIDYMWEENNSVTVPINFWEEGSDSIVVTKNYPEKLLNKFYLLRKIKSDTLELKLKDYKK